MKRDNAFTGLEAAIVLIAFVVVAAIFSYVMLGAGFFATQKAQEVTYAGIKQATSNVVFEGTMYGQVSTTLFTGFTYTVKVPGGGQAVDMKDTIFTYTSSNVMPPIDLVVGDYINGNKGENGQFEYPTSCDPDTICFNAYFPLKGVAADPASTVLNPGNFATYLVDITMREPNQGLEAEEWFSLEMIPRIGAATQITKRLSSGLEDGKPLL